MLNGIQPNRTLLFIGRKVVGKSDDLLQTLYLTCNHNTKQNTKQQNIKLTYVIIFIYVSSYILGICFENNLEI